MQLSKNGQFYRFLNRWSFLTDDWAAPDNINNSCQLWTRTFLLAVWLVLLGLVLGSGVLGAIQWGVFLFGGPMVFTVFALVAFGLAVPIALVAFMLVMMFISGFLRERKVQSEPGIIRETYRGWKDKYCPTVTWVDEDE